jgi:hypothetical protein
MMKNKPNWIVITLVVISVCVNLGWNYYSGFIRDDAYITFRYAENVAAGNGFVFNQGSHIYGTSTPGLTLLLAVWVAMGGESLTGAILIDAVAVALALLFLWWIFDYYKIANRNRVIVFILLIWSDKMIANTMEGMEIAIVLLCMAASFYFLIVRKNPALSGVVCAFMLWVRIDSAPWIVTMVMALFWSKLSIKEVLVFSGISALAYFPWLVFSYFYFGSIIPHTITAKRVAYGVNISPWWDRFQVLFKWLSPFTPYKHEALAVILAFVTLSFAAYAVYKNRNILFFQILAMYFIIEGAALISLNMTIERRYFMPLLFVTLILCGIGINRLLTEIASKYYLLLNFTLIGVYTTSAFYFSAPYLYHLREHQKYAYGSHIKMGQWIAENTPPDSTVFLEPLGYTGYYGDRYMLDSVGLVTPVVIGLKQAGMDQYDMANALRPDYVVLHCDDAVHAPEGYLYTALSVRFDPLGFLDGSPYPDPGVQRNACYEIRTIP